jgi:hypothetical protein
MTAAQRIVEERQRLPLLRCESQHRPFAAAEVGDDPEEVLVRSLAYFDPPQAGRVGQRDTPTESAIEFLGYGFGDQD